MAANPAEPAAQRPEVEEGPPPTHVVGGFIQCRVAGEQLAIEIGPRPLKPNPIIDSPRALALVFLAAVTVATIFRLLGHKQDAWVFLPLGVAWVVSFGLFFHLLRRLVPKTLVLVEPRRLVVHIR